MRGYQEKHSDKSKLIMQIEALAFSTDKSF